MGLHHTAVSWSQVVQVWVQFWIYVPLPKPQPITMGKGFDGGYECLLGESGSPELPMLLLVAICDSDAHRSNPDNPLESLHNTVMLSGLMLHHIQILTLSDSHLSLLYKVAFLLFSTILV